jgi:hypothetical protein
MEALATGLAPQPDFGVVEDEKTDMSGLGRSDQNPPVGMGGVGSAYPVNQAMASGEVDKPMSLRDAKALGRAKSGSKAELSPETAEGLRRVQELQDQESEDQVDTTEAELAEATEEILQRPGQFDFNALNEQQRILMDPDRKKEIEGRLEALDIADMILKREIVQDVPVVTGTLIYTLRTFNQQENLFCLSHVYESGERSMSWAEEYLNTCKLVCSLVAINGARLPNHLDQNGEVDREAFENKMRHVASLPTPLVADISVQTIWFEQRVNKLFSAGNLKNG